MGQDNPAVKPLLLAFGEGAVYVKLPKRAIVPVWLFDYTSSLKFVPKVYDVELRSQRRVKTGHEFLMKCFLQKLMRAYDNGATIVYACLDRGSPPNKIIEQEMRNVGVVPMATPDDYMRSQALVNDHRMMGIENDKDWKSFIANPDLYRRLVHYVTMRMIGTRGLIDQELKDYVMECPVHDYDDDLEDFALDYTGGKSLFLHGGRVRMPDPDRPREFKHPEPLLLEFKTVVSSNVDCSGVTDNNNNNNNNNNKRKSVANNEYTIQRSVQSNKAYDPDVINNLLEGEVAALFYAQPHMERGDGVLFVTPDIDMLMMLLLSCPDRIDPKTGTFVCQVWVKLVVSTSGLTRYVDVHRLWCNINAARPLRRFGSPILPPHSFVRMGTTTTARSTGSDEKLLPSAVPSDFAFKLGKNYPNEFVSKLCATCLLCGTDYVKFYCMGITNRPGGMSEESLDVLFAGIRTQSRNLKSTNEENDYDNNEESDPFPNMAKIKKNAEELKSVPWIIHTFLKYYYEFENMVSIVRYQGPERHVRIRSSVKVHVDEPLFIEFTRRVFIEHYTVSKRHVEPFKKLYGENATRENVRRYLNENELKKLEEKKEAQSRQEERLSKSGAKMPKKILVVDEAKTLARIKRNRMTVSRKIRVSSRHLLWQMEYMLNGYRGRCSIIDPTTLYAELPYYGWHLENGRCRISPRVSIQRPFLHEVRKRCTSGKREFLYKALMKGTNDGEEDEEEDEEGRMDLED